MRRGGAPGKEGEGDKVMGPLSPRLHVNDSTLKAGGGPRAPPRNKMALYEQFSVPSQRFNANGNGPAQAHRPVASYAVSSASAGGQIGGSDRPLFPSFCVPSNEPARTSEHINTNSNIARGSSATRTESGRLSTQLKSKDTTHAAVSTAECSSQRRDNTTTKNSWGGGKKTANDDDFTVPSVLCSGGVQEKPAPFPMYNNKSGPARSRDSQNIRDKIQAAKTATTNLEVGERSSSFKLFSTEKKTGKTDDDRVSSYRDTRLTSIDVSDKHQARRRNENAAESQNATKAVNGTAGFVRGVPAGIGDLSG